MKLIIGQSVENEKIRVPIINPSSGSSVVKSDGDFTSVSIYHGCMILIASNIQLAGNKNTAKGVIMKRILGAKISDILSHHNSGLDAPSKPKVGNMREIAIQITIPITSQVDCKRYPFPWSKGSELLR